MGLSWPRGMPRTPSQVIMTEIESSPDPERYGLRIADLLIPRILLLLLRLLYEALHHLSTRNPQPAIRNPQPAIRNPQSAIRNPRSSSVSRRLVEFRRVDLDVVFDLGEFHRYRIH